MIQKHKPQVKAAEGKLGVLLVGLGAVSTTLVAGIEAAKQNRAKLIGSLTQMGTIRLGKRSDRHSPKIKDFAPLAKIEDIVFGAWDVFPDNAYEAAAKAAVLNPHDLEPLKESLSKLKPMAAAFDRNWVKNLDGTHIKTYKTKRELTNQLIDDIRRFEDVNRVNRSVVVWCASTETYTPLKPVHQTLAAFEKGLDANDADISPSMMYAYAALSLGIPFANGAPNLSLDTPALLELAKQKNVPVSGKDFKTGQTFMKTVLAPAFRSRLLGISGWYSTNILGNRDGEVLDDPGSFKSKEVSKLSVLDTILQPELNPDLYGNLYHKVCINYYPPRGDNKEGWDNIDIFGWMGYPMQIKVDFLCRDSILAAPLALDLALFMDLSKRAGFSGVQEWLSYYYKSPQVEEEGLYPEHNLFIQEMKLKNTLRDMMGEEPITHLDPEHYEH